MDKEYKNKYLIPLMHWGVKENGKIIKTAVIYNKLDGYIYFPDGMRIPIETEMVQHSNCKCACIQ